MNVRKTFLTIALTGAFVAPLAAYAALVVVDVAPPAPVYEQLPARAGFVVTPGYYKYGAERHAHTWVKGDYQAERHGEHYVGAEWRAHEGRYEFNEGRWEHDK